MVNFSPGTAAVGGALLGLACALLWLANGRILGISGIVGELVTTRADRGWRIALIAGLASGAFAVLIVDRGALANASEQTVPIAIVAGLLVGFGTRLGNGCTSGHGVCGMARWSKRSLVATVTFMATAVLTVWIVRHMCHLGGAA